MRLVKRLMQIVAVVAVLIRVVVGVLRPWFWSPGELCGFFCGGEGRPGAGLRPGPGACAGGV